HGAEVEQRVPAVVVSFGQSPGEVGGRPDRGDAVEPVLEGLRAGSLRRGRIHAGGVEGAELLVGGPRIRWRGGGEPLGDGAQGGVIALDQLGEAAVARVL